MSTYGSYMGIDDARDDNCWCRNSVGDLGHMMAGRGECRRLNTVSNISINDNRRNQVKRGLGDLQEHESLPVILGLLHLGNKPEEGQMSS